MGTRPAIGYNGVPRVFSFDLRESFTYLTIESFQIRLNLMNLGGIKNRLLSYSLEENGNYFSGIFQKRKLGVLGLDINQNE